MGVLLRSCTVMSKECPRRQSVQVIREGLHNQEVLKAVRQLILRHFVTSKKGLRLLFVFRLFWFAAIAFDSGVCWEGEDWTTCYRLEGCQFAMMLTSIELRTTSSCRVCIANLIAPLRFFSNICREFSFPYNACDPQTRYLHIKSHKSVTACWYPKLTQVLKYSTFDTFDFCFHCSFALR